MSLKELTSLPVKNPETQRRSKDITLQPSEFLTIRQLAEKLHETIDWVELRLQRIQAKKQPIANASGVMVDHYPADVYERLVEFQKEWRVDRVIESEEDQRKVRDTAGAFLKMFLLSSHGIEEKNQVRCRVLYRDLVFWKREGLIEENESGIWVFTPKALIVANRILEAEEVVSKYNDVTAYQFNE